MFGVASDQAVKEVQIRHNAAMGHPMRRSINIGLLPGFEVAVVSGPSPHHLAGPRTICSSWSRA